MKSFKHINARSIEEATAVLKTYGDRARIMAGGTDVMGQMLDNILPDYPEVIVNIKGIADLDYIREANGVLHIGALTRLDDIAGDKTVKEKFTLLAEAARKTASPHIREMGTLGGNIGQSNRCWYYWVPENRFPCLRKGGKLCYALTGDSRYHSIFGGTRVMRTPCSTACPANVGIPYYLSQIREDNLDEAARILLDYDPIPAIIGRVCPHFCESDCNRDYFDEAVSIRCIERYVGDYILEHPDLMAKSTKAATNKTVAIIGSGPAGLSAAYYLTRYGHRVTIIEAMEKPGGLLTYGIPPYRLPRDVVEKQVKALQKLGIQFKVGTKVGKDIKIQELLKSFNAVFLACGAWKERPSGIKGDEFMMSGMEFLRKSNVGAGKIPGRKVAVIGGGNVAVDVARTLLRLGAEPVVIYRRSRVEMPALKDEVDKAEQEGVKFQFLTLPVEASGSGNRVTLKRTKMKLGAPDKSGRPKPLAVKGSEFVTEFDAVMKALGEEPDLSVIPEEYAGGMEKLQAATATCSLGGNLFAGGDFIHGPSTVVQALTAGREAAGSIDRYLGGTGRQTDREERESAKTPEKFNSSYLIPTRRVSSPELTVKERTRSLIVEDSGNLELSAINTEANRCFNCGCVAVSSSDMAPALIVLNARVRTTKRVVAAAEFFTAGKNESTVLDDDEIVVEIEVPAPAPGTKCKFIKFALRQSIDFPIVNCAAAVKKENGVVKTARICLNAVYNQPYRATRAEAYITGKPITESNAEAAAGQVTAEALPLVNNAYKIEITKALVKRAILACV